MRTPLLILIALLTGPAASLADRQHVQLSSPDELVLSVRQRAVDGHEEVVLSRVGRGATAAVDDVVLSDGRLLGVAPQGDSVLVVTMPDEGLLEVQRIRFRAKSLRAPIEIIDWTRTVVSSRAAPAPVLLIQWAGEVGVAWTQLEQGAHLLVSWLGGVPQIPAPLDCLTGGLPDVPQPIGLSEGSLPNLPAPIGSGSLGPHRPGVSDPSGELGAVVQLPDIPDHVPLSDGTAVVLLQRPAATDSAGDRGFHAVLVEPLTLSHSLVSWWDGPGVLAFRLRGPDGLGNTMRVDRSRSDIGSLWAIREEARCRALSALAVSTISPSLPAEDVQPVPMDRAIVAASFDEEESEFGVQRFPLAGGGHLSDPTPRPVDHWQVRTSAALAPWPGRSGPNLRVLTSVPEPIDLSCVEVAQGADDIAPYVPEIPIPIPTVPTRGIVLPDQPIVIDGAQVPSPSEPTDRCSPDPPIIPIGVTRSPHGVIINPIEEAERLQAVLPNQPIDIFGRSFGSEAGSSVMLACWSAPGELSFTEVTPDGLVLPVETRTHRGQTRQPQWLRVQDRWMLVWAAEDLSVEWCQVGADESETLLTNGLLVAAVGGESSGTFAVLTASGDLALETVVFGVILPHDILEPLARSRTILGPLGADTLQDPGSAIELAGRAAAADLRVHELGESSTVLTWWTPEGVLSFIEIDDQGPRLPVSTLVPPGQSGRPNGLLKRALREIERR